MKLRRYMTQDDFRRELLQLKAYRGSYHGDDLFDWLEQTGLVPPVVRLTWPEPIARRWWREGHEWAGTMRDPVEPDSDRLVAAEGLASVLSRAGMRGIHGDRPHPFDNPESSWAPFLQDEHEQSFTRRADRRYPVGNDRDTVLFDRGHIRDYYSAWQVLAAAEVADMGISFRLDMCEEDVRHAARAAILDGNAPAGPAHELFAPAEALQGLREHRAALDAAVWAAEEGEVAFLHAARGHGGGRFRLSEEENARYQVDRIDAAKAAMTRHDVGEDAAIALCRFLAERWREWDREGRPLIAEAYRIHLAAAVRLLQLAHGLAFSEIAVRVGPGGRMDRELLRDVWPDWAAEQRERVATTLRPSLPTEGPGALSDDELEAFARFLEDERQDAFFLRLASFETNAFDGDAPSPINGMTSDMQGMAVAVEHVVRAMGGTGDQLYSMFKQLWAGSAVEPLLKTHAQLARNAGLMKDWPELKARIATVAASGEAEAVAATLIMAHRLRGAVHVPVPEDDQLELEALFVRLMAAAAMTHAHVARRTAAAQPVPAPAATGSVAE